ncbi:MAG: biotin--[acetyl-CoA-carboxylase] ligase [Lachnospiraceae bacterium]|jgi:BirA family biotin operon repressor/biotin-[acetyl-CoA-carboxylase] ligase|nr:biotin--[acetyl-CoA-carboxylase] ligase [Lachnospiraceae bacterium]
MKTKILTILKEAQGFVSGQDLCGRLGVSRTAVWKVMKQLEEEGYKIEAVRNKGYRLIQVADVITEAEVGSQMNTKWMGRHLVYLPETDSTNIQAAKLAREGAPEGTLVVAESQTAGKGRRGRSWSSPSGSSIYMSFLLRPDIPPYCASMITLLAGMAGAKAVCQVAGLEAQIKWPNDLVVNGKKICGILTEMSAEMERIHYIVTGIGINVNQMEFPEEIRDKATSLWIEGGKRLNRSQLIAAVMEWFEQYFEQFLETKDLSGLKEAYEEMLANRNREVSVLDPASPCQGICRGIDKGGELLVELPEGQIRKVVAGEVSVRGIYGYV